MAQRATSINTRTERDVSVNTASTGTEMILASYPTPAYFPSGPAGTIAYAQSTSSMYVSVGRGIWKIIGGAPVDASYVTVSSNAQLTNERVLTAGTNISLVDGGPDSTITINATGGAPDAQYVTMALDAGLTADRVLTAGSNITVVAGAVKTTVTVGLATDVTTASVHLTSATDSTSLSDTGASVSTAGGLSVAKTVNCLALTINAKPIFPLMNITTGAPGTRFVNTAANNTYATITVPANTLSTVGNAVMIEWAFYVDNGIGGFSLAFTANVDATVLSVTMNQGSVIASKMCFGRFIVTSTGVNTQSTRLTVIGNDEIGITPYLYTASGAAASVTSGAITLTFKGQWSAASPSIASQMIWLTATNVSQVSQLVLP